jgi:hypothetical protein
MTTHTYLFCNDGDLFYRYKIRIKKDKTLVFDPLRYSGDEENRSFKKMSNFWAEWEKDARYMKNDRVDFAFLSDNKNFQPKMPPGYSLCRPTKTFSFNILQSFAKTELKYRPLSLEYKGRKEKIKGEKGYKPDTEKIFFVTIPNPLPEDENEKIKETNS